MSYLTENNTDDVQAFLDECKQQAYQEFTAPDQADGLMMICIQLAARVSDLEKKYEQAMVEIGYAHERIRKLEWGV